MYARSHIYCTTEITGSKNPYLLLGSVLPDFHQTKALPPRFDQQAIDFLKFCHRLYSDLVPVAIGMTLHEHPIGVDRFVHQSYQGKEGYAFQFVDQLYGPASKVFDFDKSTTTLMTHFLVENAIEWRIIQNHPNIEDLLKNCFQAVNKTRVCEALATFYNVGQKEVEKEWDLFVETNFNFDYSTYEGQAKAWNSVMNRLFGKKVEDSEIARLIKMAQEIIEPTVNQFMDYCIAQCTQDFEFNFPKFKKELEKKLQ